MIALLIKTSLIITVILGFYKILIEKESFFSTNRLYLVIGLVLTFTIPLIPLPKLITNQGLVSEFLEPSETQNIKVKEIEEVYPDDVLNDKTSVIGSVQITKDAVTKIEPSPNLSDWLLIVYLFGIVVLTLNFLTQIGSLLFKIVRSNDKILDLDGIIINSTSTKEPCSFFNYIFINPEQYELEIYEQIIAHEKIHVKKRHSLDLLLSELAVIVLWFNPFVWLFRREVEKNIEYQTDYLLINTDKVEKGSYQMNLLKIATFSRPLTITTNYNQSLVKQRILKMNSKKSNPHSYWKYAFTLPLFFSLLLLFNKPYAAFGQKDQLNLDNSSIETDTASETEYFSDCEAFKKALEDKDVTKLKEILINLDPACLERVEKSEQNGLAFVTTKLKEGADLKVDTIGNLMISNSNRETTKIVNTNIISKDMTSSNPECKMLLEAVRANDIIKVKELLKTTNANCIDPNPGYVEVKSENYDYRYKRARMPLFAVARTGNLEVAKLLVKAGADVKYRDGGYGTALISAAEFGSLEILKYLKSKGAPISIQNSGQSSALSASAKNGHSEIVEYLVSEGVKINAQTIDQGFALNAAAKNGHLETVKLLLDKGADINLQNNGQGSALNAAARNGHLETVKLLLDKGADINLQNNGQGSALNAAARNGHNEIIEYLILKGANIDLQNVGQGSALNAAARNNNNVGVKLLLAKGAKINAQTNGQGSALNVAAKNGHLETVKLLLDEGADINLQNNGQGSALNAAAKNGHLETVKLLLDNGADINLQNNGQGSALNAAARNGHNEIIEYLILKGANIDLQNNGQGSALNAAARNGLLVTVKLLVNKGADVNLYSAGQGTALSAASKNKHQNIVDYLLSKGAKHIYSH